jgi:hypothetical protein
MSDEWDKIILLGPPGFEYIVRRMSPRWMIGNEEIVSVEKQKVSLEKCPLYNVSSEQNLSKLRVYDLETKEKLEFLLLISKLVKAASYDEKSHMD